MVCGDPCVRAGKVTTVQNMRVAVAQYNPIIGDLSGNLSKLQQMASNAHAQHADILVTPELALTGYPPRDLLDRPAFVQEALAALTQLAQQAPLPMLVGAVVGDVQPTQTAGRIANGVVLIDNGRIAACYRKRLLPSYDVFDETRYFTPGVDSTPISFAGQRLGVSICEDIWAGHTPWFQQRYGDDPVSDCAAAGATLLINLSASPYALHKPAQRHALLTARAQRHGLPLLYVNQVGGNDALLFDGRSLALDAAGVCTMQAPAFAEACILTRWQDGALHGPTSALPNGPDADVCEALCMGLRDYMRKCGFKKVVLGLSGGIDSALVAALAVRALGADNVLGVAMPSRYSSAGALTDAEDLAKRLGIRLDVLSIEPTFNAFLDTLKAPFKHLAPDVTEENLQARVRGTLLMAYSNKFGALLLTTGNKSEIAMGYCTLYGDMNGGLNIIADLYKTQVWALARYLNDCPNPPIPQSSIIKAPSAELRPNQTDQDSLPPYNVLDAILVAAIEQQASAAELQKTFEPALVQRVLRAVDRSEYKRRQMAPGLRVSDKAFGEGWRYPVAQLSPL